MNILYNVLIQPLVTVYNVIFTMLYGLIEEPVLTILVFSVVVNFLVLPLYHKADMMQLEEIEKEKRMRPWLTHIRRHFSGDERFMMQSAYYRIEHYNPLSVLKEAGPLLLQVPFFIAAYRYVSTIPMLKGVSFGPVTDLLAPDRLLSIGALTINVLPIIMTAINCVSGYIYTQGGPIRQKIQVYGVAAIFLVLLYDSASGLVIYWIMNQVFSLCRNIIYRRKVTYIHFIPTIIAFATLLFSIFVGLTNRVNGEMDIFVNDCVVLISSSVILKTVLSSYKVKRFPHLLSFDAVTMDWEDDRKLQPQVLLTGACLALLMGVFIPSNVLSSSVREFVNNSTGEFQWDLLAYPMMIYGGLFLIWTPIIIFSRSGAKRKIISAILWVFLGVALVNHFIFDTNTGAMYADLTFQESSQHSASIIPFFNLLTCLLMAIVFLAIFINRPSWTKRVGVVIGAVLLCLSVGNIFKISNQIGSATSTVRASETADKVIQLSKNGRNVVVIMLDRAIGGFAPFIFDELPNLGNSFQGFVYYPNTVSFGDRTNFGAPGLFGGYEYIPSEMNKRDTELLSDKYAEALKLMPTLFSERGYHSTVVDLPSFITDSDQVSSIFADDSMTREFNLAGKFADKFDVGARESNEAKQRENFIAYSLSRTIPIFMKSFLYKNDASYGAKNSYTQAFLDQYSVLKALSSITSVKYDSENYLLMFQNSSTHEPVALNPPDYLVDGEAVSDGFPRVSRSLNGVSMSIDDADGWKHYCVNVASCREIAAWLDYLKEQGVYDNTRIIIASDHGRNLRQFGQLLHPDGLDIESVWPLLLVKDFESRGPLTTSNEFMTNADVPMLAMQNVIVHPVNPFTGNIVSDDMKKNGDLKITDSSHFSERSSKGTTFDTSDGHWWTVHDNIFDMNNWSRLED